MKSVWGKILIVSFAFAHFTACQKESVEQANERVFNGLYQGVRNYCVAFPLSGLGAGMYCIEGTGFFSNPYIINKVELNFQSNMLTAIRVLEVESGRQILDWRKSGFANFSKGKGIDVNHACFNCTWFDLKTIAWNTIEKNLYIDSQIGDFKSFQNKQKLNVATEKST